MPSGKFTTGHRRAAKLTADQVQVIRLRYADGWSQGRLSREFGMSVGQIGRIVRGESWADYQQVPTDQELEHAAVTSGFQPTPEEIAASIAQLERMRSAPVEPEVDLLDQVLKRRGGDDPLRRLSQETRNADGTTATPAAQSGAEAAPAADSPAADATPDVGAD